MQTIFILSDGEEIPLLLETRRGLRNITIRPKTTPRREIHISIPWLVGRGAAIKFLESKRRWIEKIYARAPQKTKLQAGDKIEIFGKMFIIAGTEASRQENAASAEIARIRIGGRPEFLERRLRDHIKKEFLIEAKKIIRETPWEFWPKKIALRDTISRWGSCSNTGAISLSWRLAFAPPAVMKYVILHELSHKKHMDHSPAFWRQVSELYGPGVERAKLWLARNGAELHKYL